MKMKVETRKHQFPAREHQRCSFACKPPEAGRMEHIPPSQPSEGTSLSDQHLGLPLLASRTEDGGFLLFKPPRMWQSQLLGPLDTSCSSTHRPCHHCHFLILTSSLQKLSSKLYCKSSQSPESTQAHKPPGSFSRCESVSSNHLQQMKRATMS